MAYGKARIDQIQSSTKTVNVDDLLTNAAGSVTSTQIADNTITNVDINASAAIALSKLGTGALPTAITVASANIVDNTIVDGDINPAANITGTKVNPNFGSQNTTTTGTSTAASFIPSSSTIPTNGVYLPAANSVGIATNSAKRIDVSSSGTTTLTSAASTAPLVVNVNTTEALRVDSSSRLLVGTDTARTNFNNTTETAQVQIEGGTLDTASFSAVRYINSAGVGGGIRLGRTRGTAINQNTVVASGDGLGFIEFSGADGTELVRGATIAAEVDGTPGANSMPGRLVFSTNSGTAGASPTERMRIDSNGDSIFYGNVYSNPSSASAGFFGPNEGSSIANNTEFQLIRTRNGAGIWGYKGASNNQGSLLFKTHSTLNTPVEAMRIDSSGAVNIGAASVGIGTAGAALSSAGSTFVRAANTPVFVERLTNDGNLIGFYQDGTLEGAISVAGTTVTYGGGHLARWSQLPNDEDPSNLLKGTVLSNLDEMCEWGEEGNEQLNRVKVSDIEGDINVAGVFVSTSFSDDGPLDFFCAMTGDMIIRIAEGTVVQRGDLLMSAGDGTAKPQGDDIIRSKTVAKVTSNHVTCTYDDGSYCVPCVLMAC